MTSIAISAIRYILYTILTISSSFCKAKSRLFHTGILIPLQMISLLISKLCSAVFSWLYSQICHPCSLPVMIVVSHATRAACRGPAFSPCSEHLSRYITHTKSFSGSLLLQSTIKYILVGLLRRILVALLLAKHAGLHIFVCLVKMKRLGTTTLEHREKLERKAGKETSFLDLPGELRNQVYMHCFCAGKVYPYAHAVSDPTDLIPFLVSPFPGPQSSEAGLTAFLPRSETLAEGKSTADSLQPWEA